MTDIQPDLNYRSVQEVASRLDVSPATLRKWCSEFSHYLSPHVNNGTARYTDKDVDQLDQIKTLMSKGLSYDEVRQQLESDDEPLPEITTPSSSSAPTVINPDQSSAIVLQHFSESISEMRQGQMSVLNSQAANRELMGVIIQDNFNLKEENTRLRQRMLDLERQMGEIRRENQGKQDNLRQEMDSKLREVRDMASQSQKPITVLQTRSGCLGSLFGGRSMVQSVPNEAPPSASPSQPPLPKRHPRPSGPPE